MPTLQYILISLSERKIEILTDILKVSSDQYHLFSGNVFKQTESKVENRVWDEVERKFVSPTEYERNREMEKATLHSELLKTYEHTLSYFVRKTGSDFLRFFDRNKQAFSASQTLEKLIGDESEVFKEIEEKRKASQPMDIILGNSISQPDQTLVPTISDVIVDSTEILRRSAESIRFGLDFRLNQILQTIRELSPSIRESIDQINFRNVVFINEWKRRHSDDYYNDDEINVPHLASGGIVSKPTLSVIGENEPEAVIPLNKLLLNEDRRSVKDELKEVEEEKIKKEEKSYRSSSLDILQKILKEFSISAKLIL